MTDAATVLPLVDLFSPAVRSDPYPAYRILQEQDPVHWCAPLHGWMITRHADVGEALTNPVFSPGGGFAEMFGHLTASEQEEFAPLQRHLSLWIGTLDPPVHTRIRQVLRRAFSQSFLDGLRPYIEQVSQELIAPALSRGELEVVNGLAAPLPAMVIARLLGTPPEDCDRFMRWSLDISNFIGNPGAPADAVRRTQRSVLELVSYVANIIDERKHSEPKPDLISMLLSVGEPGGEITEEELLANSVMLLFAGHGTITVMISVTLMTLLQVPGIWKRLLVNPDETPRAIEEVLRFDSPCQLIRRLATDEVTLAGKPIKKGDMLWLNLGAANRDPRKYSQPDEFLMDRREIAHFGYGFGIHHCLGAALSRVETDIVVRNILKVLPNVRLSGEPVEWHQDPTARAMTKLLLQFDPVSR